MIKYLNRITLILCFLSMAACMSVSFPAYGQKSDVYKPINIDSLLLTPVILPNYNAYRISHYQFIVFYTGTILMADQGRENRLGQLSQVHADIKLPVANTDAMFKTKGGRKLEIGLKDNSVLNKLQSYIKPKVMNIEVKMIEGNYKSTKAGLDYQNIIYRDFIIQDIEVIKN